MIILFRKWWLEPSAKKNSLVLTFRKDESLTIANEKSIVHQKYNEDLHGCTQKNMTKIRTNRIYHAQLFLLWKNNFNSLSFSAGSPLCIYVYCSQFVSWQVGFSPLQNPFQGFLEYPTSGELFDVDSFKCRSQLSICSPCGCNVVRAMSTDGPLELRNEITRESNSGWNFIILFGQSVHAFLFLRENWPWHSMHIYTFISLYISLYICISIYMSIYLYIYLYIYIYIYIYMYATINTSIDIPSRKPLEVNFKSFLHSEGSWYDCMILRFLFWVLFLRWVTW